MRGGGLHKVLLQGRLLCLGHRAVLSGYRAVQLCRPLLSCLQASSLRQVLGSLLRASTCAGNQALVQQSQDLLQSLQASCALGVLSKAML